MIRFTVDQGDSGLIVLIAGHLDAQHLGDLSDIVGDILGGLTLDLSELQSTDAESAKWLKSASFHGAEIVGASPYVALLIERSMPTPADSPTV